jgi:hypothetical protein
MRVELLINNSTAAGADYWMGAVRRNWIFRFSQFIFLKS